MTDCVGVLGLKRLVSPEPLTKTARPCDRACYRGSDVVFETAVGLDETEVGANRHDAYIAELDAGGRVIGGRASWLEVRPGGSRMLRTLNAQFSALTGPPPKVRSIWL